MCLECPEARELRSSGFGSTGLLLGELEKGPRSLSCSAWQRSTFSSRRSLEIRCSRRKLARSPISIQQRPKRPESFKVEEERGPKGGQDAVFLAHEGSFMASK